MKLNNHELQTTIINDVNEWLKHTQEPIDDLAGLLSGTLLSPQQKYELESLLRYNSVIGVFDRLQKIINMATRYIYLRKNEEKAAFIKNWLIYNYNYYVIVYQSVLDVSLLLVNTILDLGISEEDCKYNGICKNRNVKDLKIHSILADTYSLTKEHRTGKNLLLHRGEEGKYPLKTEKANIFNIGNIAKRTGIDEGKLEKELKLFLSVKSTEDLQSKMCEETNKLESIILTLFDELLIEYHRHNMLKTII
jgi:hypothetical protein